MDKSRGRIENMFDSIAPKYDMLNHVFTLNMDKKWRKEIVKYVKENNIPRSTILDLASGTGDLTVELLKLDPEILYSGDISEQMLAIQREKIKDPRVKITQTDALHMPFESGSLDIVTIGFGARNFEDLGKGLTEINRVLKKGGYLVVLEMFNNPSFKTKIFDLYFGKIMPVVGNMVTKSKAYSYLNSSVKNFLTVKEFENFSRIAGFDLKFSKNNFLGVVNTVYLQKT